MTIKGVTIVNIIMPWWLRWAKRFIRLQAERKTLPAQIKGYSCDSIIIDEVSMVNNDKK